MRTFPAELLDAYMRLQSVANDHHIRALLRFSAPLDVDRLRAAIVATVADIPVLRSRYLAKGRRGRWMELPVDPAALLAVVDDAPPEPTAALYGDRAGDAGPQIHFLLARGGGGDCLAVTVNHLAMDGVGFKACLYRLADAYDGRPPAAARGSRSLGRLLRNLRPSEWARALLRRDPPVRPTLVLQAPEGPAEPTLRTLRIDAERFAALKRRCADMSATVNDGVLALFARALFETCAADKSELSIQVMFDLRRYAAAYRVDDFGNFASMETLAVANRGDLADTIAGVHAAMAALKRKLPGVKNVLLMGLVHALLPRRAFAAVLAGKIRGFGLSSSNLGVLDHARLRFAGAEPDDAVLLTAVKFEPALQLSFSAYRGTLTLSALGRYSPANRRRIDDLFRAMEALSENFA